MKRILIATLIFLIMLFAVTPHFLGFSFLHLGHALQVATSLSAKLACSAKFISNMEHEQIVKDLSSYSPATKLVSLSYFEDTKKVEARLLGLSNATAIYNEHTGCYLTYPEVAKLDVTSKQNFQASSNKTWPDGKQLKYVDLAVQAAVNRVIRKDNESDLDTRALIVVYEGELVAEAYGKGFESHTPLLGWSMGKSLTAIMLGRLEQLDKVNRNETKLFDEWQDDRQQISLSSLLQMTSGLAFDETYAPGSDATHMLFTAPSASDVALQSKINFNQGEHFSYSSGTTNLLTRYIHQVLGNDVNNTATFLNNEVFSPLSIDSAVFETDASGVLVGSSYIYASARDWARLGLLMVNQGLVNGKTLLSKSWVADATTPNTSNNEKAYGYQFWLNKGDEELRWPSLPEDAYAMMGNRHQSVMMLPSEKLVMVRLGWTAGDYPMEQNYKQLVDAVIDANAPILPMEQVNNKN